MTPLSLSDIEKFHQELLLIADSGIPLSLETTSQPNELKAVLAKYASRIAGEHENVESVLSIVESDAIFPEHYERL